MTTADLGISNVRRKNARRIRLIIALGLWTFGVIAVVFYFEGTVVPEICLANGLLLILVGYCLLPWWVAKRRSRDKAEVIVLFGLWFGLAYAFKAFDLLWGPFEKTYPIRFLSKGTLSEAISWAIFISLLGLIGVLVGYYIPLGKYFANKLPIITTKWPSRYRGRALFFLMFGLFAILAWVYGFFSVILPEYLAYPITFILEVSHVFVPVALFFLWKEFFQLHSGFKRIPLFFCYFILTVFAVSVLLLRSGKLALFEVLFAILLARHYFRSPIRLTNLLLVLLAVIFLVFPLIYLYRGTDVSNSFERISLVISILSSLTWDSFWQATFVYFVDRMDSFYSLIAITEAYPHFEPFLDGKGILLQFANGFLPRVLWPEKPIALYGVEMSIFLGGTEGSSSAVTQIGDLYRNFGAWGVFPGMVLVGIIMRFMYEWCMRMVLSGRDLGYVFYIGTLDILIRSEAPFAEMFLVLPRILLVLLTVSIFVDLADAATNSKLGPK